MSISKLISNYSAYNEWANHKVVVWLKGKETMMLNRETPSSFNTVDATLQHTLRAQKFWLAFVSEEDITDFNWGMSEAGTDKILKELDSVSTQMKIKFSSFTEEELLNALHLKVRWVENRLSRYEYIIHVINHSTYHRGQIVTMAHCMGINDGIVNTDYNFFRSGK